MHLFHILRMHAMTSEHEAREIILKPPEPQVVGHSFISKFGELKFTGE